MALTCLYYTKMRRGNQASKIILLKNCGAKMTQIRNHKKSIGGGDDIFFSADFSSFGIWHGIPEIKEFALLMHVRNRTAVVPYQYLGVQS